MSARIHFFVFTTVGAWLTVVFLWGDPEIAAGMTGMAAAGVVRELVLYAFNPAPTPGPRPSGESESVF